MTALEHQELKGITVKNLVVTVVSTASIVASVMTTYFGLKNDILEVKTSQTTETRVNNIRLKILEDEVALLQKQVAEIKAGDQHEETRAKNQEPSFKKQDNGNQEPGFKNQEDALLLFTTH
jgi:hypothetical protein